MNVKIKAFDVDMQVKNKGIEFEVRKPDGSAHIGDCYLTKSVLIWCKGKKAKNRGVRISWNDFIAVMKSKKSRNAAIKAAKQV